MSLSIFRRGTWLHHHGGWLISALGVLLEAVAMCGRLYTVGLLACIPIALGWVIHIAVEEWDLRH